MDEKNESYGKEQKRMTWAKSFDFLFSCMGAMIGLGNIWRFPYLCYQNGGGAFLVPYLISAVFIGFPLNYLEVSFGQMIRKGLLKSWATIPIMKGIAFSNLMVLVYFNIAYAVILTWVFKYFLASFSHVLPWTTCSNTWNTERCYSYGSTENNSLAVITRRNFTIDDAHNNTRIKSLSASEEFLKFDVWSLSGGIEDIGQLKPDLAGCLAIIWVLIYLAVFRGVKWSAKIVYVTSTVPVVLIFVVLVRGVMLDGAYVGIHYYLLPKVDKLASPEVWIKACTQVLYSNAVCSGGLLTLGSYNKYRHNFQRDSLIIVSCNCLVSFIGGFAVFSVLGFMSSNQGISIEEVATSGPGLVFVTYPQALSFLPLANFWCALFFFMLLLLGFDSEYVHVESMGRFVIDNIAWVRKSKYGHSLVFLGFSLSCFAMGLVMVTKGGVYIFEIFNQYGMTGWCIYLIGACEFIAVGWCYGANRYFDEIEKMIGPTVFRPFLTFVWMLTGPSICLMVTGYYLATSSMLKFENYTYPVWAQWFANIIAASTVVAIPAVAIHMVLAKKLTWKQLLGRNSEEHDSGFSLEKQKEQSASLVDEI